LLSSVIDFAVAEKRMQFRGKCNINIEYSPGTESYGLFADINLIEFKRVLSNIINNAVEAIKEKGEVKIVLEKNLQYLFVKISDTGPGIPQQVIDNLGKRGNTYGKKDGEGLGLFHAVETLQKCNGTMDVTISSKAGTTILIKLPISNPPSWFLKGLEIKANTQILILDDDASIHQVWDQIFSRMNITSAGITIHHFSNKNMLGEWLKNSFDNLRPFLFLCDYEIIGSTETGLDVIEFFKLESHSVLVTGRSEEIEVQKRCEKMKVYLLPKTLSSSVPVKVCY